MTTLKQALNEMRSQPVIGAVTLAGTALAIFLIMIVVMINNVKIAPIAPEAAATVCYTRSIWISEN